MEQQLISKETAVLAKEKGFNEETYDYFNQNGECETSLEKEYFNKGIHTSENIITISCPTQSLLQKWLREKHRIYIMVYVMEDSDGIIYYEFGLKQVVNWLSDKSCKPAKFNTYEEALEFGLQKALTFVP